MNRATENYLKSIYELSLHHDNEFVKLSSLAKSLGFTSQSVNEMIKRLVEQNLVVFIPYQGVKLSDDGKKIAIELIRSHRIWEAFLLKELLPKFDAYHPLFAMGRRSWKPANNC